MYHILLKEPEDTDALYHTTNSELEYPGNSGALMVAQVFMCMCLCACVCEHVCMHMCACV